MDGDKGRGFVMGGDEMFQNGWWWWLRGSVLCACTKYRSILHFKWVNCVVYELLFNKAATECGWPPERTGGL